MSGKYSVDEVKTIIELTNEGKKVGEIQKVLQERFNKDRPLGAIRFYGKQSMEQVKANSLRRFGKNQVECICSVCGKHVVTTVNDVSLYTDEVRKNYRCPSCDISKSRVVKTEETSELKGE